MPMQTPDYFCRDVQCERNDGFEEISAPLFNLNINIPA